MTPAVNLRPVSMKLAVNLRPVSMTPAVNGNQCQ
jgi:hypothetical protein